MASAGPGLGTTFFIELPLFSRKSPPGDGDDVEDRNSGADLNIPHLDTLVGINGENEDEGASTPTVFIRCKPPQLEHDQGAAFIYLSAYCISTPCFFLLLFRVELRTTRVHSAMKVVPILSSTEEGQRTREELQLESCLSNKDPFAQTPHHRTYRILIVVRNLSRSKVLWWPR
jgi:hypothetical protein